jgi:hypothetical protein
MAVIDGPGGPLVGTTDQTSADDEGFARLAAYSPDAARNVLAQLSAQLREHDLDLVTRWSDDVGDQLLD